MSENIRKKILLYCALHGNNALVMCNDATKEANCIKCRAKNEGICNIRYENPSQILYELKTGKIIKMSGGGRFSQLRWMDNSRRVLIDGAVFDISKVDWCWFCFGFLENEK